MLYSTHVRVHLGNIRKNIEAVRKRVGPDCKIMVSVKANAYGHGAVAVAKVAEQSGVDWLGVATVPEGMEIRRAGISLPILKLSPAFPEEMEAAIKNRITLTVCEQNNIKDLQTACARLGHRFPVHIKVDTGMGRLGVQSADAPALALWTSKHCPDLEIEGVFSHFPMSDDPAHKDETQKQIETFASCVTKIQSVTGTKIKLAHIANSGAILDGDTRGFLNMVRMGIMTYGIYPSPATPRSLELLPGLSFLSRVAFIKQIKAGTGVGYGHVWKAAHDTRVATIPVGYADGFNRLFSNKGQVLIGGKRYPVVGRVCMDQIMIDIGATAAIAPGDQVTLIGRDGDETITADDWATTLGTIPYEVTCQINTRVERVVES